MSSPMQNPVPPAVQPPVVQYAPPRHRRRSFAGPVVLIILGIVFLLGNLHMLSWMRLGTLFAHYWPALLILWGVIKLVEYQQAQRDGVPARGIGVGGFFLVILIVVFGLMATQASRFNWGEIRDNMNIDDSDLDNLFGQTYNFDDHLEQDVPANATSLRINDDHGAVRISAANDNKITVVVRKRVGAESQNDADKYNKQAVPAITSLGNVIILDAHTQASGDHSVQSDLDISIPRKMEVHITSRRGDVSVIGRDAEVEINSAAGPVPDGEAFLLSASNFPERIADVLEIKVDASIRESFAFFAPVSEEMRLVFRSMLDGVGACQRVVCCLRREQRRADNKESQPSDLHRERSANLADFRHNGSVSGQCEAVRLGRCRPLRNQMEAHRDRERRRTLQREGRA